LMSCLTPHKLMMMPSPYILHHHEDLGNISTNYHTNQYILLILSTSVISLSTTFQFFFLMCQSLEHGLISILKITSYLLFEVAQSSILNLLIINSSIWNGFAAMKIIYSKEHLQFISML